MNHTLYLRPLGVTALILLIPLIAMQFSSEVLWTVSDFVVVGVVLFTLGMIFEYAIRGRHATAYRVGVGLCLFGVLLLLWMNGAVGIIGNEDNPANLLYGIVLLTGLIGAIASKLEPHGLMYTAYAMAASVMAVPILALAIFTPDLTPGVVAIFVLSAGFATIFSLAALCFKRSFTPSALSSAD